jgi:EXS family
MDEDESSVSSIQEFVNTWDDDMDESARPVGRVGDIEERAPLNAQQSAPPSTSRVASDMNRFMNSWRAADFLDVRADASPTVPDHSAVGRFRQNHPRITRFGSFFFFRSSQSSTHNAEYAPSGPAVFGAALDLSMPVLFNFHLFIEAFNHMGDSIATKTLPLIFLTVLIVRTCFPPKRRMRFWNTVSFIFKAPYQRSRFRDSYLGDVLTSLVRPCQDILFALSYYVTVIWGTVTGQHGLHRSGEILQQSWLLMNVILPACAILPLWFKFLQTLRECYDTGKRWPHLGNAFKYMSASLVVLYGMTHPEDRRSPVLGSLSYIKCFGTRSLIGNCLSSRLAQRQMKVSTLRAVAWSRFRLFGLRLGFCWLSRGMFYNQFVMLRRVRSGGSQVGDRSSFAQDVYTRASCFIGEFSF